MIWGRRDVILVTSRNDVNKTDGSMSFPAFSHLLVTIRRFISLHKGICGFQTRFGAQWATCTLWPLVWCLQGDTWFSNPFWGSVGYLHFVATCLVSTRGYVVFKPVLGLNGLPALCGHLFGVYKGIHGFQTRLLWAVTCNAKLMLTFYHLF